VARAGRTSIRRPRRSASAIAALVVALGAALGGCAAAPPPAVPIAGSSQELSALVGDWEGEYSSEATGRSGSIRFTLRSAADSAFGDVVMIPAGAGSPLRRAEPDDRPGAPPAGGAAPSEVLTIRFVRAEGGTVSGSLDPYHAPDCSCILTTTFLGELRGDVIEGTFTTAGDPMAARQPGRWRVTRR
jgi:hypothetical protein